MHDPLPACPTFLVKALTLLCQYLNLNSLPAHSHELIGAFLLYYCINVYISPAISPLLFPQTYRSFNMRTRVNWDVHVVSLVQSVLICVVSVYVMSKDEERRLMNSYERIWSYTEALGMVQAFGAGYFAWDLLVSVQHVEIFGVGLLAHAICALCVFMLGFRPFVNYYAPNFLLYELSSPFLNLHWFMDKLQMTGSRLQLVNGLCLLAVFFSCRLVYGTWSSYRVGRDIYRVWTGSYDKEVTVDRVIPAWLGLAYLCSNLTLNFLNIYWFSKMIDALRRRFASVQKPSTEAKQSSIAENSLEVKSTFSPTREPDHLMGDNQVVVEGINLQNPLDHTKDTGVRRRNI